MNDDVHTARNSGRLAGKNTATFAGECPYPHSKPSLREAWMDGFGQGRDELAARHGDERIAEKSMNKPGT